MNLSQDIEAASVLAGEGRFRTAIWRKYANLGGNPILPHVKWASDFDTTNQENDLRERPL